MKFCKTLLLLLLCCTLIDENRSLIHDLQIEKDGRRMFYIENFGFEAGGLLNLTVANFELLHVESHETLFSAEQDVVADADRTYRVGFLIKKTDTDSARLMEENEAQRNCLLDDADIFDATTDAVVTIGGGAWRRTEFTKVIKLGQEGFYNVFFVNCESDTLASYEALLTMHNRGPSYLPAGEAKLPQMYAVVCLMYVAMLSLWIGHYMRHEEGKRVLHIHYLMTALVALKLVAVLFESLELRQLDMNGHPGGWAIIYYVFATLKGIMMFVVILLIGSGWSFVKPFLSEQDKRIFMFIIPLQLIDNLAMIIIEETAPGSQGFFTWKDIFRLVDIICCGAILIPIIWSIRHLREAAQIDGKAARNIYKLKLFRQFYLLLVSYIYFTRVIVYLLDATLPFRHVWLGQFFTELATLAFYLTVGYKFRPVSDNPYFKISDDELIIDTLDLPK
jgi:G protein-coupled receptor 107